MPRVIIMVLVCMPAACASEPQVFANTTWQLVRLAARSAEVVPGTVRTDAWPADSFSFRIVAGRADGIHVPVEFIAVSDGGRRTQATSLTAVLAADGRITLTTDRDTTADAVSAVLTGDTLVLFGGPTTTLSRPSGAHAVVDSMLFVPVGRPRQDSVMLVSRAMTGN